MKYYAQNSPNNTRALLIVDVQNDFCEGGALPVTGGHAAAGNIAEYLQQQGHKYRLLVATRDWHEATGSNGEHFAQNPDHVDTWPAHCVQDTPGAAYAAELPLEQLSAHIRKGMGTPAYSGFQGVEATSGKTLEQVLRMANIQQVDVVGIATDYCVSATALDAQRLGFRTTVLLLLTAAVGSIDETLAAWQAAGVRTQGNLPTA